MRNRKYYPLLKPTKKGKRIVIALWIFYLVAMAMLLTNMFSENPFIKKNFVSFLFMFVVSASAIRFLNRNEDSIQNSQRKIVFDDMSNDNKTPDGIPDKSGLAFCKPKCDFKAIQYQKLESQIWKNCN